MIKKILYGIFILIISLNSYSQSVRITTIVEGDCPTGSTAPRVVELYVEGTVDVTNLKLQFQFASATNWVLNNSIGAGEYTDSFLYVVNDVTAFDNNFPGIRTNTNTTIGTIISNVEGGEKIRLVDGSNNDEVIDIYGIDGQNGENTTWNFSNSYVKRKNSNGSNTQFDESEWDITTKNTLLFKGKCWNKAALNTIIGLQAYTLSTNKFDKKLSHLKISPNPSKDFLEIEGLRGIEKYHIYNSFGQKLLNGFINNNEKIKTESLSNGAYVLKTENGNMVKSIKK